VTLLGSLLQVCGLVLVVVAAFVVAVPLGFVAAGAATFAVGFAFERRG